MANQLDEAVNGDPPPTDCHTSTAMVGTVLVAMWDIEHAIKSDTAPTKAMCGSGSPTLSAGIMHCNN